MLKTNDTPCECGCQAQDDSDWLNATPEERIRLTSAEWLAADMSEDRRDYADECAREDEEDWLRAWEEGCI